MTTKELCPKCGQEMRGPFYCEGKRPSYDCKTQDACKRGEHLRYVCPCGWNVGKACIIAQAEPVVASPAQAATPVVERQAAPASINDTSAAMNMPPCRFPPGYGSRERPAGEAPKRCEECDDIDPREHREWCSKYRPAGEVKCGTLPEVGSPILVCEKIREYGQPRIPEVVTLHVGPGEFSTREHGNYSLFMENTAWRQLKPGEEMPPEAPSAGADQQGAGGEVMTARDEGANRMRLAHWGASQSSIKWIELTCAARDDYRRIYDEAAKMIAEAIARQAEAHARERSRLEDLAKEAEARREKLLEDYLGTCRRAESAEEEIAELKGRLEAAERERDEAKARIFPGASKENLGRLTGWLNNRQFSQLYAGQDVADAALQMIQHFELEASANAQAAHNLATVKAALPTVLRHHRDSQDRCVCADCLDFRALLGLAYVDGNIQ